ncbi:replication factor RFC1 C terminal domain-containing protein [Vararia minispora EC-137]|uniref:Replication factor RFC1 C terminal domain-containing protein n=1 Tax=Vararia minispora EC-137 TaxID=1314806 RepID=A0ACB8QI71_9AGAM|nr:replication factor RFC1 C terminal domain-containing protein [Vararia minispora EC-137]
MKPGLKSSQAAPYPTPSSSSNAPPPKRKKALVSSSDDEAPRKTSCVHLVLLFLFSCECSLSSTPIASSKPAAVSASAAKRKKSVIVSDDDDDDASSPPKKKPAIAFSPSSSKSKPRASVSKPALKVKGRKRTDDDFIVDDDDDESESDEGDDDDFVVDEDEVPKAKRRAAPRKSAGKPAAKGKGTPRKADAAPRTQKPKEEEPKSEEKPKLNWAAAKAAKLVGPSNPGSKTVPEPASLDCLAGLTFVFTGQLDSLAREEAIDVAKKYGGRVTGQPSSKTSYVVVGSDAGPSKLAAIKKNNLPMLDEDGFLNLIATRRGPDASDEKIHKQREKERAEVEKAAREMEQREKAQTRGKGKGGANKAMKLDPTTQLWTDRYAPQSLKEICGNKGQVEKLLEWLEAWPGSLTCGFKKPGKHGMNVFRGVLISGPPGIGKTTTAHLCAKIAGFVPIELNASDVRSKKLVENSTNISNTSLDGWMGGGEATNVAGVKITEKSCLIMDEVDGMSAGDRGGVGALAALIRKTKARLRADSSRPIPIICIANDRTLQKMKPLTNATFNMTFRKPEEKMIRSRIMSIAFKEGMKVPANVIDNLVKGVNSDIRQVLNMLSTWKLSSSTMDFDESKALAKMNEKYTLMSPFTIIHEILGPHWWERTSRKTLNDKMELYFQDYSFMPLFMQENYLKTQPSGARNLDGAERAMKELELMEKASASISDGDLVDSLIHGSEQHWTLMPTHAVLSTVRPASFMNGSGGYQSGNAMSFPQWLGQNSKRSKLARQLGELQSHMRLRVSGDKAEMRQAYIPALYPHVVHPLVDDGATAVDGVIEVMDDYYLTREDWDTLVELGVGDYNGDRMLKKISTATKTSFTRKYNAKEHPVAYHKAQDLGKVPKRIADAGPAPDLEEAFDVDEEVPDDEDDKKVADDDDIAGDKLISDRAKARQKADASSTRKAKGKKSPC